MSNLTYLLEQAPHLVVTATTSVWSWHNCGSLESLAKRQGTNIYNALNELKQNGESGEFTLFVDSIGRSGHSASSVVILKGLVNIKEFDRFFPERIVQVTI